MLTPHGLVSHGLQVVTTKKERMKKRSFPLYTGLMYIVVLGLLFFAAVGVMFSARMQLGIAPPLQKISLAPPSYLKIGEAWELFEKNIPNIPQLPKSLQETMSQMKLGQWPQLSLEKLRLAFSSLRPMLQQTSKIFQEESCPTLPTSPHQRLMPSARPEFFERVPLLFRLLVTRAVIWSISDSLTPAVEEFKILHKQSIQQLTRCRLTLQYSLYWLTMLRYLHEHIPFLLVHPQLTPSHQQTLVEMLSFWHQPPTFLAQMLTQEFHDLLSIITQHMKKTFGRSRLSYWNQPDTTKAFLQRWFRRYIHLATQPTVHPPLWGQAPIEKQLHPENQLLSVKTLFRHNTLGFVTLSHILSTDRYRSYLLFWFQQRCRMTAFFIHWRPLIQHSPQRRRNSKSVRAMTTSLASPYALHPFTQKSFPTKLAPKSLVCSIPKLFQPFFPTEEHPGFSLPPLPAPYQDTSSISP